MRTGDSKKRILLSMLPLMMCGCLSPRDNAKRLMARDDFPQAASAAPEWCRDALKTVNRLEHDLELR